MPNITDIIDMEPIPNVFHPSDGINLHYEHDIAILLYNIWLQLRVNKGVLDDIKEAILDSPSP